MKEKRNLILISLGIVFLIAGTIYFQPSFFKSWIIKLESDTYDRQLRRYYRPLSSTPSVAIVAIDDKSLEEVGRWPWDRDKIAKIALELKRLGASVIAFDMVFSEPQSNAVKEVMAAAPALSKELEPFLTQFDADSALASALSKSPSLLGFAFTTNGKKVGTLPSPLLTLSSDEIQESLIPNMNGYICNLPLFQSASAGSGFLNTTIDSDGILRFSPLIMRDQEKVYPAFALAAAKEFLSAPFTGIVSTKVNDFQVIQSISLGNRTIHTDPWGRILIPFEGPPFSFPYLSAVDLLNGKVDSKQVQGKLIFIGLSATASSDLMTTAISPAFPGVEVQATIANGIIENYLPYKPHWGRGLAVLIVLIVGAIAALTFPFISHLTAFIASLAILGILEAINYWAWSQHGLVLSFFFPLPTLAIIFVLDLLSVIVGDIKHKKEIKKIFGETVSAGTLDQMLQKKGTFTVAGESKEITVLFGEIWDFPKIAANLSAPQLKEFLNGYLTDVSEIVFREKGVLDRYVRDQLAAFWGAPFPEQNHASLAVKAALAMTAISKDRKIGIGIDTGTAQVGDMGSKFTHSYTAIGEPVDLAHHLKKLTVKYSVPILVSERTKVLTENQFNYRKVDEISFNGKQIPIYSLTG
ncbi:MAG: adenylate/guanylate cyclase domain-containing protein [Parachlamydiales bacterium]|nr:adenylate/guanylate cyclase domain-containing protein [Parachlamydiales bacterium]